MSKQRTTSKPQVPEAGGNQKFLIVVAVGVLVGIGVIAFLATRREAEATVDLPPATVEVEGEALSPMPEVGQITTSQNDPAAGSVAPALVGTGYDGNEVRIENDGRAKVIYFIAHWCSHCQVEVPLIQELIDGGEKPEDLDIYAVSTAVDSGQGNYPPAAWLKREGFTPPVLRDDAESTAYTSVGPAGFPFAIYLNKDHEVVSRSAGSLSAEQIKAQWAIATG